MAMAHPVLELRHQQIDDADVRMPDVLTDAVLIDFAVLDDETIAFAVTRGRGGETKIVSHRIAISRKVLAARVDELTTSVARRTLGYSASARRLYRLLLKPFEAEIAAHHTVCIIRDGVLWHLPFQVLQDALHQPLVARAAVMYAPSMAMLAAARTRDGHRGAVGPLVAFGNPELPAAEAEVRSLARLYGAARSRVYVGGAARESTFKREVSTAGILHLATHGFLEDRAPMYSALVLAAGGVPAEDGLLEAREILAMHVPAALVVLAACDSGRGVVREGEGLIGMTWALLVAGCPTTVVSQWKADSAATAALMVDFHRGLLAGRTPADALREAQLKLLRGDNHRHPYYWAPFVVIGDGQRVLHVAGR
jgi:CHAT domain-containing protein